MHGAPFEDYCTTAQKYRYNLICSIEAYEKLYQTYVDSASIGGGILISDGSKINVIVSPGHTLNFVESWIQSFEGKYSNRTMMYREKISSF